MNRKGSRVSAGSQASGTRVSAGTLWTAAAAILLVQAFGPLPRGLALCGATAAPWATLLAGAAAFLMLWPVLAMLSRRPGQCMTDLCLSAGGRLLTIPCAFAFSLYAIFRAGISLRLIAEMAVTAVFPHTPQTFVMVSLLLIGALAAQMQSADLLWLGGVAFWPLLLGLVLILVGNLGWSSPRELLPLAGPGLLPVAGGLLPLTSVFGSLMLLVVLSPYTDQPSRLVRQGLKVTLVTALAYGLTALFYLAVFPYPGGLSIPFPLFEMTRLMKGGRFLERMDGIWLVLWASGGAYYLAGVLHTATLLLRDGFRLPSHRQAVLPLSVATLAAALFPSNQAEAVRLDTFVLSRWGFLITLVLPLAIAMLAQVRGRRSHA